MSNDFIMQRHLQFDRVICDTIRRWIQQSLKCTSLIPNNCRIYFITIQKLFGAIKQLSHFRKHHSIIFVIGGARCASIVLSTNGSWFLQMILRELDSSRTGRDLRRKSFANGFYTNHKPFDVRERRPASSTPSRNRSPFVNETVRE